MFRGDKSEGKGVGHCCRVYGVLPMVGMDLFVVQGVSSFGLERDNDNGSYLVVANCCVQREVKVNSENAIPSTKTLLILRARGVVFYIIT